MEIRGITVKLHKKEKIGVDGFNKPVYEDSIVEVDNVLVTPLSTAAKVDELNLTGKTIMYELSIPKGDSNNWVDTVVEFFDVKFHTVGFPTELIEILVPGDWNKKVKVEKNG